MEHQLGSGRPGTGQTTQETGRPTCLCIRKGGKVSVILAGVRMEPGTSASIKMTWIMEGWDEIMKKQRQQRLLPLPLE